MKIYITVIFFFLGLFTIVSQSKLDKGDSLFANGNYTKAIETYTSLKNLDAVYSKIAKAYSALGNYGEALVYYKNAVDANPEDVLAKYDYAKLLGKTKKYIEAKALFNTLIITDSLNPNYYYEKGVVLERLKDTTAINDFKKAYELDQTHQKAIFKIAKKHIFKRRFKEAHTIIDVGFKSYSDNVDLISLKAQAYYFQEYYDIAVVWFKKLLDLGEKSEFIHEKLSLCYAQNSDYENAIYHRLEALKYNPNDANAMYVIGLYYRRLSNFEKAEEFISKALLIWDKPLSDEYQRLGIVLNRQKKYQEAIKAFQKSLKEDPSNINSEFFILKTKDEYYADIDEKIKLYEDFIKRRGKSFFRPYAEQRLKALKEEKFRDEN